MRPLLEGDLYNKNLKLKYINCPCKYPRATLERILRKLRWEHAWYVQRTTGEPGQISEWVLRDEIGEVTRGQVLHIGQSKSFVLYLE